MSRLDVLLVTPPSRVEVYGHLADLSACEPPVWSGLIASYLRRAGISVHILDAEAEGLSIEQTADRIGEENPRLAAFSVYGHQPSASTQCMPAATAVARLVIDSIRTAAFGTHVSALPGLTVMEGAFDFAIKGEGHRTIAALVRALNAGTDFSETLPRADSPPGLTWICKGAVVSAPDALLAHDLDEELPHQEWDLLDMSRYRAHNWHLFGRRGESKRGYASVQTSLGCPFKCSFCCINAPFGGSGYRKWSAKNVGDQLESLIYDHSITNVKFPDEMFVLDRRHVTEICAEIGRRKMGSYLNMWAYARIDTVKDEEMLDLMREAGFTWLGIGIESGSKHVRDGVEKGRFGTEDIRRALDRVKSAGIEVGANYIFGLPDDTRETMSETLALAEELNTAWANFYCAMAYPGSALHRQITEARVGGWGHGSEERAFMARQGLPEDPGGPGWIGYSQHAFASRPLQTETLSYQEVLDFRDEAFIRYFTNPNYISNIAIRFGPEAVAEVLKMVMRGKPARAHREAA